MSPDPTVRVRSGAVAPVDRGPRTGAVGSPGAPGFDRVLTQKLQGETATAPLRWSAHARDRLAQRQIAITPEVAQRLEDAVAKAAAKGAKESLVLVDNLAFVDRSPTAPSSPRSTKTVSVSRSSPTSTARC